MTVPTDLSPAPSACIQTRCLAGRRLVVGVARGLRHDEDDAHHDGPHHALQVLGGDRVAQLPLQAAEVAVVRWRWWKWWWWLQWRPVTCTPRYSSSHRIDATYMNAFWRLVDTFWPVASWPLFSSSSL